MLRRLLPLLAVACLVVAVRLTAGPPEPLKVGRVTATTGVAANGWLLTPVGDVTPLGDTPQHCVFSPDGSLVAVSNCGQSTQSVMVLDKATRQVRQRAMFSTPKAIFRGLAFSRDGQTLYISGGPSDVIHLLRVKPTGGISLELGELLLRTDAGTPVVDNPETFAGKITLPEPSKKGVVLYPGGLTLAPGGHDLWVAETLGRAVAIVDPDHAANPVKKRIPVGANPYDVVFDPAHGQAYVSLWGAEKVAVLDLERETGKVQLPVGKHPAGLCVDAAHHRLYVANAHSDTVSIIDTAKNEVVGTISVAPYPGAPLGSNPTAIAVNSFGSVLYVADSGNNAVDVITLNATRTAGTVEGRLPTGWYPTSVAVDRAGAVWVTSAKGVGTVPNGHPRKYIGSCLTGTLQRIADPRAALTAAATTVTRNNHADAGLTPRGAVEANSPIPARVGAPSPIKHCVYIIKENRTYDQVYGDLAGANGDPTLTMFGEEVTPNQHKLARTHVILDNFYCDGEVSVDGHQWCKAASVSDAIWRGWGAGYSRRGPELGGPLSKPASNWLWEQCEAAKVSCKVYSGGINPGQDLKRVETILADVTKAEKDGTLPQLILAHLPNNHTLGTSKNAPTPKAMVAENDLAVGRLIEGLSKSTFWPRMAVFVVEDDAQDGPDHVDCHRSPALVLGPWVKRGVVEHELYDQMSVLRTIELIVGLPPLSQFDAAALPMFSLFATQPTVETYTALTPAQSLEQRNALGAYGQRWCAEQDFDEVDRLDPAKFNEVLWRAVVGDRPVPPARHTRVALAVGEREDD